MGITGAMTSHLSNMSPQSASIFSPLTPCHFSLSTTQPRNIPSPPLCLPHRGCLVLRATNNKTPLSPILSHKRTFKFKSLMGQFAGPCFLEPVDRSLGCPKSSTLGLQRTLDEISSPYLRDTIVASVKESQPGDKVRKGGKQKTGVKDSQPGGKVRKGDVVYAVVVRAAMPKRRSDGTQIKFDDNAAVLVNKKGEPIGTRVFGPVPQELRRRKHVKILSLAEHIV